MSDLQISNIHDDAATVFDDKYIEGGKKTVSYDIPAEDIAWTIVEYLEEISE